MWIKGSKNFGDLVDLDIEGEDNKHLSARGDKVNKNNIKVFEKIKDGIRKDKLNYASWFYGLEEEEREVILEDEKLQDEKGY